MKKFIAAILAIFYLGTSVGATVHLHYCMGKVVNWSLWNKPDPECSNCGMEKDHGALKDGCCKDEQKIIKNSKDEKLTQSISFLILVTTDVHFTTQNDLPEFNIPSITETNPISHAPPRGKVAVYIRNRVFLI